MIDLADLRILSRARSLDDAVLAELWERLWAENLARAVFYAGGMEDFASFRAFADEPGRLFYAVTAGGGPAALFWLDGGGGGAARIHFAAYRRAWGRAARIIGLFVTDWLLTCRTAQGRRALEVLVGVTPASHAPALKFIADISFTILGTVPGALVLADGSRTGAVVSYLRARED
ncbi:hypothetical protein [Desulfocurvus sp. DL9XJH121]